MSTVKRRISRGIVLLAVAAGLIAALAAGRGISGVGHGSSTVSAHHALADGGVIHSN